MLLWQQRRRRDTTPWPRQEARAGLKGVMVSLRLSLEGLPAKTEDSLLLLFLPVPKVTPRQSEPGSAASRREAPLSWNPEGPFLRPKLTLPAPRSLERPLLAVAEGARVRHNSTWHGYTKPILVFKPLGRLGNVMGVYASVWAVGRAYDVNVFMEAEVEEILRPVFPRLSMSALPVRFVGRSWVYLTRGGPD
ncbi:hypothetical protein C7M84_013428 [Penaeus vannamei]|uniref:Uncharacterized protein n=1 Tax=Penaeus vannamei TaxID=6689 RepID=A0A423SVZ2_PENVA|nr:hypothetical protein C7M84_013428 [Penaeus vannamei]